MAFYCRMKLPPLKLNKHPLVGKSASVIHRGVYAECSGKEPCSELGESTQTLENSGESDAAGEAVFAGPDFNDFSGEDEPTHHELQSKSSVEGWEQLRNKLLSVATECSAMPLMQICLLCPNPADIRCQECGPSIFYCNKCFCSRHEKTNFFHVAEKWEDDHFITYDVFVRRINVLPSHSCASTRTIMIKCLDDNGMEHSVQFVCCLCEPVPVTMIRAQLWPATPHHPKFAFTFKLLDWAESLLLECQVSLKDFCQALYFRCPYSIKQRRDVYTSLIDSFEEYRVFKNRSRHLSYLSQNLDRGTACPACPKSGGRVIYSMDALFGLPRKKAAGVSYRNALEGDLFFCDQASVDEVVANSSGNPTYARECNDFLAGNALRSATRYKALDETALFGAACRHEFPAVFLNLKHGERLSYAVYLIDSLLGRHESSTEVFAMYDIACSLQKHLKHCGRSDLSDRINLCLPTFHSYGHKASCQLLLGPLRCKGVGLSDGEVMERLWSYLRRFNRMTKEMRPAHRIDILVHALVYYGMRKKDKLGKVLVLRWSRAHHIKYTAEETFQSLAASCEGHISERVVEQWLKEEAALAVDTKSLHGHLQPWKCEYFHMLHLHSQLREKLASSSHNEEKLGLYSEVKRLDKQLQEIEEKYNLPCRWNKSDREYKEAQITFSKERLNSITEAIWTASSRRHFLLKSKAKYADGQKIAKKLSQQIAKETKEVKMLLPEYNACQSVLNGDDSQPLQLTEALEPSTFIEPDLCTMSKHKREIIDAYLMIQRSSEEIDMVISEMDNTLDYYINQRRALQHCIQIYGQSSDSYSRGAVALLKNMLSKVENRISVYQQLFCVTLTDSNKSTINECYVDSDDSDLEFEDDSSNND